jgi:DNA-binding NtrC family response regulator
MHNRKKIILVEDDNSLRSTLGMFLERSNYDITEVKSAEEAIQYLEKSVYDLVITDFKLYGKDGMWLLHHVRTKYPDTRVMLMSAFGDVDTAVDALKEGAVDFVEKPFTPISFIERCKKALEAGQPSAAPVKADNSKKVLPVPAMQDDIVGRSYTVRKTKDMIRMVSDLSAVVLLTGENGTGKELTARKIHDASGMSDAPFVVVNCDALPANLLETELLGLPDGESKNRAGLFEEARGGTLFLDEIGSISPVVQAKLLELLDQQKTRELGSIRRNEMTFRVVCSTAKDLSTLVKEGNFRQDLYYRINVVNLYLEPLRERSEDIPVLMDYFLESYRARHSKMIRTFDKAVYEAFEMYDWPGNIRELKTAVERGVIFCNDDVIQLSHVPESVREPRKRPATQAGAQGILPLKEVEKEKILEALRVFGGNKAMTAKALGIGRNTLWRKLKEYDIDAGE